MAGKGFLDYLRGNDAARRFWALGLGFDIENSCT
jgi:hypothetical protein